MSRPSGGVRIALVVILVIGLLGGLAGGHAFTQLSADPQRSADGTVVLESGYAETDGFIALYDAGQPAGAEPIGVEPFSAGRVDVTEIPVRIEAGPWAAVDGHLVVRAVMYHDDGETPGQFDAADSPQLTYGEPTATTFAVGKATGPVYVSAAGVGAQRDTAALHVREVALERAGHLVVRRASPPDEGTVIGVRSLEAGVHSAIAIPLDERYVAAQSALFSANVTIHTDDGDGVFEPADPAVSVDGAAVGTRVSIDPQANATAVPRDDGVSTPGLGTSLVALALLSGLVAAGLWVRRRRAEP